MRRVIGAVVGAALGMAFLPTASLASSSSGNKTTTFFSGTDGLYVRSWGPLPNNLGTGAWNKIGVVGVWSDWPNPYYDIYPYFYAINVGGTVYRRLGWEQCRPGDGCTTWYLNGRSYKAAEMAETASWRVDSSHQHMNWWYSPDDGTNGNAGYDITHGGSSGSYVEARVTTWADGCRNDPYKNDMYGALQRVPSCCWTGFATMSVYGYGSSPTWKAPVGNGANGASLSVEVNSCP